MIGVVSPTRGAEIHGDTFPEFALRSTLGYVLSPLNRMNEKIS